MKSPSAYESGLERQIDPAASPITIPNAQDLQRFRFGRRFDHRSVRKTRPPMAGIYCGPLDLTEVHMSDRNKARVGEFLDRVLTGGDIEATGDYFERDMVEEVPFPGQGPGLDGLKETLIRIRSAFPDSNWTVEEQIAEGDKVLSRFVWSGTHQGEFLGIPATHRPIRVWGMVIDRFAGEKIVSTRILMDTFGMMIQLGVISNPAQQAR